MDELIYLAFQPDGSWEYQGRKIYSAEAATLIMDTKFATETQHADIVASDDRDQVARYGTPRSGASLAAALAQ